MILEDKLHATNNSYWMISQKAKIVQTLFLIPPLIIFKTKTPPEKCLQKKHSQAVHPMRICGGVASQWYRIYHKITHFHVTDKEK